MFLLMFSYKRLSNRGFDHTVSILDKICLKIYF